MRLGDYIHFNYGSYRAHGLHPSLGTAPDKPYNIAKAHQTVLKKLVPPVPYLTLKELEKQLNFFYGNGTGKTSPKLTKEERNKLQAGLLQYLQSKTKDMDKYHIDFSDLSAIRVQEAGTVQVGSRALGKDLQGTKFTWARAVMKKIDELDKIVQRFPEASVDLSVRLDQFKVQYEDLLKEISVRKQNNRQISQIEVDNSNDYGGAKFQTFIDGLNDMLHMVTVLISTQILGELGESVTAIMPHVYQAALTGGVEQVLSSLSQTLDQYKIGNQRSAYILDPNKVLGVRANKRQNAKGKLIDTIKIGDFGAEAHLTYTQDKIDVMLKLSEGKAIPASVKNVAANSDRIHILSGSSVLKYLQLYPVFGNHYLNVTANIRVDEDGRQLTGPAKAPARDVAVMHNALLSTIGTHALIGGLISKRKEGNNIYKSGKAEVFVVNTHGRGQGRFRVYAMANLLDNIERHIQIEGDVTNEPKEWVNKYIKTKEGKSAHQAAYARCITILHELHAAKLRVSLKTTALKS